MKGLAFLVAAILAVVALIHVYWALGGVYGIASAAPVPEGGGEFKPPKLLTFLIACLLAGLAVLALMLVYPNLPLAGFAPYFGFFVALVFVVRAIGDFKYVGFFKSVKNSDFARKDSRYFSPLCLFLGVSFAWLSFTGF